MVEEGEEACSQQTGRSREEGKGREGARKE
jgi:hypothetical protein